VGTLILAAFAAPLSEVAFKFGPAEYFSLMILGLIGAVVLASGSLVKAVAMIVLGLLMGLIGTDVNSGGARFSFDIPELTDGIGFIVIAMGVFGYGEIIQNLSHPEEEREVFTGKVTGLMPTGEDFRNMIPAVLRGTALGSMLGILPGGGALLAAFAAYTIEKKTKLRPGEVPFGKGNIRGVAAPESANNAGSQTSFIPLLTLGIPPNAVMALMVGAMTIHNIQPGPQVMTSNPQLFWGLIASMWIGNAMLVILNLPLIGIWIKLLTVPYRWLFPAIVLFCAIGVYSTNNNTFDIWMVGIFGVIGYGFIKLGCEPAPLLLGLHPGSDDGREPAARPAAVARRLERVRDASAVGRPAGGCGPAADHRSVACGEEQASRGFCRRRLTPVGVPHSRRLWAPFVFHGVTIGSTSAACHDLVPYPSSAPGAAQRNPCPPAGGDDGATGDLAHRHGLRPPGSGTPAAPMSLLCCATITCLSPTPSPLTSAWTWGRFVSAGKCTRSS
jgi:hypothetical protein